MGCGPGIGGFLMDDLIYPRLWQANRDRESEEISAHKDTSDIRRLFPQSKKHKKSSDSQNSEDVKKKGTPEWLAMSVGVFFVGGLFAIASYRIYTGSVASELDHVSIHSDGHSFKDEQIIVKHLDTYNGTRLPTSVLPTTYLLYVYPQIEKKTYTGLIRISIVCKEVTSQIILHSSIHTIRKIDIKSSKSTNKTLAITSHVRNKHNEMLIIKLSDSLEVGETYHLFIGFGHTLIYSYDHGIYLTKYKDGDGKEHQMVSTDFEPLRARRAFPCFDEPAMKATYTIIIQHKEGYRAISNMRIVKNVSLPGGNVESFFEATPIMSSYLVSIVVSEYEYKETKSRIGVPILCYAPAGRLNETTMALKFASLAVDYYSKHFGIPYKLPKLGLYPVASFSAAADETWGNIVFNEDSLLFNPLTSTQTSLVWVAKVVCHEISHQWFGDLVTMKWWNDLWLKESFASYLENLPLKQPYPSWDLQTSFYSKKICRSLNFDASKHTHAIESHSKKISYDAITYDKGASIVNMLGKYVGNARLFKGLKVYLNKYAYKNANITQLWDSLSEGAKTFDVKKFMDAWVTKPGFPLVTVKRVGNKFVITQEKYVYKNNRTAKVKVDSTVWYVAVAIKMCEKISNYMLKSKSGKFKSSSKCTSKEMFKANYGASGFYRVNYDDANWARLLKQMNTNHKFFPVMERANILADLYSLVRFNYVDITLALDFTKYLDKEHHPVPFNKGLQILNTIRFVFGQTKLNKCARKYTVKIVRTVMEYLNKLKKHTHSQKNMIHLTISFGVTMKMQPLTATMENKFLKWMLRDGKTKLPRNLRYLIMHTGVVKGNKRPWNFVYKKWKRARSISEKAFYLSVLSSTSNKKLLERLVNESVPNLNLKVLTAVCKNWIGRPVAWAAVKENWEALYTKYISSTSGLDFLLLSCLGNGRTTKDLNVVKSFMKTATLGPKKVCVERIIETIEHNIDFKNHQKEVTAWFKKVDPDCLK